MSKNKSTQLLVETTQEEEKFPQHQPKDTGIRRKNAILNSKSNFIKTSTEVWIKSGKEVPLEEMSPEELESIFRVCEKIVADASRYAERFQAKASHFSEIRANIFDTATSKGINVGEWLKQ